MGLTLTASNLRVSSDRGRTLLDIPNVKVSPGQCIGIKGASGAGKSTLLFALAGLLENCTGHVYWGETELLSQSAEKRGAFRALNMGLIFQDFLLFEELSALENATLPGLFLHRKYRKAIEDNAMSHLERLGLGDLNRPVASFSGGERQRVAVARALAINPPVLLADEPTASLHRDAADALTRDLTQIARLENKTLIAVSHDQHLLNQMDQVLTLVDGKISNKNGLVA